MQKLGFTNTTIKKENLNLVLRTIYDSDTVSRAAISRSTGLSRSTVSELTSQLIQGGIIEECGIGLSSGGRKPIMLRVKPYSRLICIIHIDDEGGITVGVEDILGNKVDRRIGFAQRQEDVIPITTALVNELSVGDRLVLIVLAVPGIVTTEGMILTAVTTGWRGFAIGAGLQAALEKPVITENATALAAYGEYVVRREAIRNMLYIRFDAAVGAGIVNGGRLYRGIRGSAVEFGHMSDSRWTTLCKCGRRGCLETRFSRQAVYAALVQSVPLSRLPVHPNEHGVFEWLIEHERVSDQVLLFIKRLAAELAESLIDVINLLGSDKVVIENPLCHSKSFWETLTAQIYSSALPVFSGELAIAPSILGPASVTTGASYYGRDYFLEHALVSKGNHMEVF